jgi:hypothetical protein
MNLGGVSLAIGADLPDWGQYVDELRAAGDKVLPTQPHPDDPQAQQEAAKAFLSAVSGAYLQFVNSDADYPEFVSIWNDAFNLLAPNPDSMYTWTAADGKGAYRIRGFRNTAHYVEISVQTGSFLDGSMQTVANIDLDGLKINSDTSFELLLSAERPKGYDGNWVRIPPETDAFLVRSQSYDWVRERDAVLAIERVDVPTRRPRPSAEDTAKRVSTLAAHVQAMQSFSYARFADLKAKGVVNRLVVHNYVPHGPAYVKMYLEGLYDIADDEALIVETNVPKQCRYWSFLVTDDQFGTVDWVNHQSSLNGFQAALDKDGKFRGVIALKDPGVRNWLDTGGYHYGVIQGRWDKCDSEPMPTVTKVKLRDVRKFLPADTPAVSASEREASLRERRMGAQFRRKW